MDPDKTSAKLKAMRLRRGLTQSELARWAGTSTPTVSRYENGWSRFEFYTLNKLATALGCRLRVELEPLDSPAPAIEPKELTRRLRRLFWDRPLRASDLNERLDWVVKRVLEFGNEGDVRLLHEWLGRERFLNLVATIRFDSLRTRNFWRQLLEQEGIACTRKSSREAASGCWRG